VASTWTTAPVRRFPRSHRARLKLFATAMRRPPPPDLVVFCAICGVELRARAATFDEHAVPTCRDCTGRVPDDEGGS
jgi:hypothetical protein